MTFVRAHSVQHTAGLGLCACLQEHLDWADLPRSPPNQRQQQHCLLRLLPMGMQHQKGQDLPHRSSQQV